MATKEINKEYYNRNRKFILLKKKLLRNGEKIPPIVRIPHQDGRIYVCLNETVLAVEVPYQLPKSSRSTLKSKI
jgi:hypothetical protein